MGDSRTERKQRLRDNKKASDRPLRKIAFRFLIAFVVCGIILMGAVGMTAVAYIKDAPKLDPQMLYSSQSSTILDMKGNKVADVAGKEYRKTATLDEVPKRVQNAFLSVEDARFWKHDGLDYKRIAGAVVANLTEGFGAEGGSTITQQLVKKSFLSQEKSIKRKVQEAYLAKKLEKEYSKEEILEMYLNKIYFGEGAYGIATAAEVYFGKPLDKLNTSEAALLAGLPQRPSGYNPFEHPDLAEKRRNVVLSLMDQHGYISGKERTQAESVPVSEMLAKPKKKTAYNSFTDQVIRELKSKGITEEDLFTQGLKIHTTLDPLAQQVTDKVLKTDEYIAYPDDRFKAGIVLLDTKTGEIRAIGGNRETEEKDIQRGYNYATQLKRQPGSTAKPIMAYGPAIEKLKWSTNEQIKDEEIELNGKVFKNWDNQFHGYVSMRKALQWSYNIPAIKAMQEAGMDEAKEFAGKLGIPLDEVYPSYAIGGFKNGISPMQLAGAYSAFGNEGIYNEPHTVRKIEYPDGKVKKFQPESIQAMSDYTAYMLTDMMKTVVNEGTGTMANIPGLPLAGKTGTNELPDDIYGQGVTDAWFAGYTTRYTAAVWTGYDKIKQDSFIQSQDSHIAKLIFKQVMSEVSEGKETPDFKMPSSVVKDGSELYVRGTSPVRKPVINEKPNKEEKVEEEQPKEDEVDEEEKEKEEKEKEEREKEEQADKDQADEDENKKPEQKPAEDPNKGQPEEKPSPKPEKPKPEKPKPEKPKPENPKPQNPPDKQPEPGEGTGGSPPDQGDNGKPESNNNKDKDKSRPASQSPPKNKEEKE